MNSTVFSKNLALLLLRRVSAQRFSSSSTKTVFNHQRTKPESTVKNSPAGNISKKHKQTNFEKRSGNIKQTDEDLQFSIFLNSSKNDPDNFGTLNDDWNSYQKLSVMPDEKGDVVETEFLFNKEGKRRLTINQYAKIIKQFIKQKKIGHAIGVLETRMLKEDRVVPDNYIYNLLIGACGEVGYTKKAFSLYKMMKVRQLKVTGHTYTALFNSCANSPLPDDGLARARLLRQNMQEKAVVMNPTIYHSMIKAFGRCGDLETAFLLVDEMLENKIVVTDETFNFLLQACITDKTAGFRHALLVWLKMKQRRVRPNLFTFNLLLRSSRDCGLGDETSTQQVIQVLLQSGEKRRQQDPLVNLSTATNQGSELTVPTKSETLPNLITQQPTMGNIVAVNNISKPEHRLMLMGGSQGVLEQMNIYKVKPDIKTFTQLLDQIPSSLAEEQVLLGAIKKADVILDIDFYNMLIRKRCLREDYNGAKDVLKMIQADNLKPDIMSFGVLAMTCNSLPTARQFLRDINMVGYRPNVQILGTLLKNACFVRDCDFVMEIMKTLNKEGLKANKMLLKHLDNFYRFSSNVLSKQDTDDTGRLNKESFNKYREYYQSWRQEADPGEDPHPWSQFTEVHSEPEDLELMNRGRVKYEK